MTLIGQLHPTLVAHTGAEFILRNTLLYFRHPHAGTHGVYRINRLVGSGSPRGSLIGSLGEVQVKLGKTHGAHPAVVVTVA